MKIASFSRKWFWLGTALSLALGAALQIWFFERGFYSIGWDEAGRTLDAHQWARDGSVQVQAWLPFYRVVVGMALRVFPDLVLTPRIVTGVFGLACIPAVGWLAFELFESRRIALLSMLLAAVFSHRIALSLAPLSSILFAFVLVCAMATFVRWQRSGRPRDIFCCGILLAIACTVRYEGWLFAPLVLATAWSRGLPRGHLTLLGLILGGFPLVSAAQNLLHTYGPVMSVMRDAQPFSFQQVIVKNPAAQFVYHNGLNLNLLGTIPLALLFWRGDRRIRTFSLISILPLAVLSAGLLVARSAQTGPAWRDTVGWGLLLLPFTGWGIAALARRGPFPVAAGLVGFALLATASFADVRRIQARSQWAFPPADRAAGAYLGELIRTHPGTSIRIESTKFFYLNVLVASQHPEAFLLSERPSAGVRPVYLLFQSPLPSGSGKLQRQFGPWSLYCAAANEC